MFCVSGIGVTGVILHRNINNNLVAAFLQVRFINLNVEVFMLIQCTGVRFSVDGHRHRVTRLRIAINCTGHRNMVRLFGIDDIVPCNSSERDIGTNLGVHLHGMFCVSGIGVTGVILHRNINNNLVAAFLQVRFINLNVEVFMLIQCTGVRFSVDGHRHRVTRLRIAINCTGHRNMVRLFGIDDIVPCNSSERDVGTNCRIEGKDVSIRRCRRVTGGIRPANRHHDGVITFFKQVIGDRNFEVLFTVAVFGNHCVFNINSDLRTVQVDGNLAVYDITRHHAMQNGIGRVRFIDIDTVVTGNRLIEVN